MCVVWEKGVVSAGSRCLGHLQPILAVLCVASLLVQYSGKMDPCRFVEVTSTKAAQIFNIYPQKVSHSHVTKGNCLYCSHMTMMIVIVYTLLLPPGCDSRRLGC